MSDYQIPSTKEMLEAGLHFGHQSRRWNPQMEQYIFNKTSNTHVIDLEKTYAGLENACDYLYTLAKQGKSIIFVGTKKQASAIIKEEAKRSGAMYITERWLGGTITNFRQIKGNIAKLIDLELGLKEGRFKNYTKKERLDIEREIAKLELMVGGIRNLKKVPDAIVVIDIRKEKTVISESARFNVPVIALVDTNSNPKGIDYVIPGNDDSIRSIRLVTKTLADAVEAGYLKFGKVGAEDTDEADAEEKELKDSDIVKVQSVKTFEEVKTEQEEIEEFEEQVKKVVETEDDEEDVKAEVKPKKTVTQKISELGLSTRAENALINAGYEKLDELKDMLIDDLKAIKSMGEKSAEEVFEFISKKK